MATRSANISNDDHDSHRDAVSFIIAFEGTIHMGSKLGMFDELIILLP